VRAGRTNLASIDPRAAPEELSPLVEAFNDLLARLQQTLASHKRFIADAAHQMKTPLAGLRTQTELALRETDPQELKRSLQQIAAATERATHLINQLLALARASIWPPIRPRSKQSTSRLWRGTWCAIRYRRRSPARIDLALKRSAAGRISRRASSAHRCCCANCSKPDRQRAALHAARRFR